jgi:rhodanese-related sulfurtransferase
MNIVTITASRLHDLMQAAQHIDLIDVRTPVEFREMHVAAARNVPLDRLNPATFQRLRDSTNGGDLYVICRSGNRAQQACEKLAAAGFENLVKVEGGTLAWDQAGLPLVRGKKAISLERQVRIAAGLLVLIGATLSLIVHPYWAALSAFIGAGLVFAGITDTCGMGMLLARMPWNQNHLHQHEA